MPVWGKQALDTAAAVFGSFHWDCLVLTGQWLSSQGSAVTMSLASDRLMGLNTLIHLPLPPSALSEDILSTLSDSQPETC